MRRTVLQLLPFSAAIICLVSFLSSSAASPGSDPSAAQLDSARSAYGQLPLSFEANRGQSDPSVRFLSHGSGYTFFLTDSSAVLAFGGAGNCDSGFPKASPQNGKGCSQGKQGFLRMSLLGASTAPVVPVGEDRQSGAVNYFLGKDSGKWQTNVATFAKVRYPSVYPGIDLLYHGNQRNLEYDFVIAPGSDPASIRVHFDGQQKMQLTESGDLLLQAAAGSASFHKPVLYQERDGHRETVEGRFELAGKTSIRFRIGAYDHALPLIIDPVLVYSTYLGGSGQSGSFGYSWGDQALAIKLDADGNAYITGTAYSFDFPTTATAYRKKTKVPAGGNGNMVFISKLNSTGTALVYSTYLGGSGQYETTTVGYGDTAYSIAIDKDKCVYVTGGTYSPDYPLTPGAYVGTPYTGVNLYTNVFVTKLSANGSQLLYSTLIGPGAGRGIAVDSAKNAYLTGFTAQFGYPAISYPVTAGAFQTGFHVPGLAYNAPVGFITKINPTGSSLVYSTYLGGSGTMTNSSGYTSGDGGLSIAIDSAGDAFVTGETSSYDFPVTAGAFQTTYPGKSHDPSPWTQVNTPNAFVTEINPAGSALIYSTYLGGLGNPTAAGMNDFGWHVLGDKGRAIAVDAAGYVYVAGTTVAQNFPTTAGAISTAYDQDYGVGFISKLNPSGTSLEYSTLIGASKTSVLGLAVDSTGSAYITGSAGAFFPESSNRVPSQSCCSFVSKLSPSGTSLTYSTVFGGSGNTVASALALDNAGHVYIAGQTFATDLPGTAGAFQSVNNAAANAAYNAFVSELALGDQTIEATSTSVALSAGAALYRQGVPATLVAAIQRAPGADTPTGQVTLSAMPGSAAYPTTTKNLGSQANAIFSSSTLPLGLYSVAAQYSGDGAHLSSGISQPEIFRVYGPPATLSLSSSGTAMYGHYYSDILAKVTDSTEFGLKNLSVTFSGAKFQNATLLTDQYGYAWGKLANIDPGTYTIAASTSGLPVQTVAIKINPAFIAYSLHPGARKYGQANPAFLSYSTNPDYHIFNSDNAYIIGTSTATVTSPVGIYPVTASVAGPDAWKYNLYPSNTVTLSVNPALLLLKAGSHAMYYGHTPPALTGYSLSGFVNGETASIVTGAPNLTTTVTATSPVGYYPITTAVGTLKAPNYIFGLSAQPGVLQVQKAPLTLTANNITVHHGDPLPPFTYTLAGFFNGDTQASAITGVPSIYCGAGSNSKPGTYPINIAKGSLVSGNYAFTPVNGVLTVLP